MTSFVMGELSKHSPGLLLLVETLAWCRDNEIEIYDFTYGDEAYKRRVATSPIQLMKYECACSLAGHFLLARRRAWNWLEDLWDKRVIPTLDSFRKKPETI